MFEKGGKLGNMKKSKLAIGLMTALLSVGALSACSDVTYSREGVILTYTREGGKTEKYTAQDLFDDEFKETSSYQTVFDTVYKLVIKNYFEEVDPDDKDNGKNQLASLKTKAETAVEGDKQTAQKKADANGTSYDSEFDSILSSKGCEDEDELYEYYLYQYEEETFNENFEKNETNMTIMKKGTDALPEEKKAAYENNKWNGYFNDKVPYHLSHILVKIEDSDSTNYSNAKVSSANAHKLARVAEALRTNGYHSFGETAEKESDDSAKRGDLGLVDMDKTAQYINEFKYAVYAYENLYGKTELAQKSSISVKKDGFDIVEDYKYNEVNHLKDDVLSAEKFATIPYGAFEIMESNAERETGYLGQKVHDGNEDFFPRNIFFNIYLNRHSLALVTPKKAKTVAAGEYMTELDGEYAENLPTGTEGTGFHNFTADDGVAFTGTYLATSIRLSDKTIVYRPILVVRGGSGSGDGGYQGIHFIVINRSPFEYVNESRTSASHVASLDDYYTTFFPSQSNYPVYYTDADGKTVPADYEGEKTANKYQTYVNYSGNKDDFQTRADEVKSAVKGYDSEGLKYFMFKKYLQAGKLSIKDEALREGLNNWMKNSIQNKAYNANVEWENNWVSYIENLKQATKIQQKHISRTCAVNFSANHTGDDAWNKIGGECNDGKQHN